MVDSENITPEKTQQLFLEMNSLYEPLQTKASIVQNVSESR